MLRWKIFIPLAVVLTAAGLLISHFWTQSATTRHLSALDSVAADIELEGNTWLLNSMKDKPWPKSFPAAMGWWPSDQNRELKISRKVRDL